MLELLAIMLVFVDLPAGLVLFLVKPPLLAFSQVTVVGSHVRFLLVLGPLLAIFQMRRLSRRQRPVLIAVGDAVLLILFAAIDFVNAGMTGIDHSRSRAGCVAVLSLSSGGANRYQTTHCQDQ